MMTVANSLSETEAEAKKIVDRFVRRFDESYRLLIYHAAIPLILTPELLNYLRHNFLRGQVPWVAEVDLLLSDLFNPVGYELYAMDTAVRAYLLSNIEEFFHEQGLDKKHLQEVALVLLGYIKYLARTNSFFGASELQAQQWAAMVCLEDKKEEVFQAIKQSFQNCVNEAELARLTQITQELSPQLSSYPSLIQFAESVRDLLLEISSDLTKTKQNIVKFSQDLEIDLSRFLPGIRIEERIGLNQILLVEDNPKAASKTEYILSHQGKFTVIVSENFEQIMNYARSGEIDLILLNYWLNHTYYQNQSVTGVDIARMIRSDASISSDLVIIGLSSITEKESEFRAYCDGFYPKPVVDGKSFITYLTTTFNLKVRQTRKTGKHYAIAIGINQYRNPASSLPAAQYAVQDAAMMQQWFSHRGFGRVDLLTDVSPTNVSESPHPLTHAGWQQFLQQNFKRNALSAEDTLWFYFSGYGVYLRGHDYLLFTDSDLEKLEETALPLIELVKQLQSSGAGKVILLLDADRDRSIYQATTRNFSSDEVSSLEQQLQGELSPEKGLIVFYASSPEQGAYEIGQLQQGSFTYALQEALAATQGNLSIERLEQFLRTRVTELNQQYNLLTQSPQSFVAPSNLQRWIPFPSSLQVFEYQTPTVNRRGEIIQRDTKLAQYFSENLGNNVTLEMVSIRGGKFKMGSPPDEAGRYDNESPQHDVTVPPCFIGKYPITQAQWRAIASRKDLKVERDLEPNPSSFKDRDRCPVEQVSWYDAVEFCARLSKQTGKEYRLPSEAEWEYACRAGTTTPFYFGETITGELANYDASRTYADELKGEYRQRTTPVGQFPPNAFGLYDMHGNLWEWCLDDWHNNYEGVPPTDGTPWFDDNNNLSEKQGIALLRGGSWYSNSVECRCASRLNNNWAVRSDIISSIGFRVVCAIGRILQ